MGHKDGIHKDHKGPCTYDVRKILGILDTPLPLVHISRNLSVLFVRKIGQFVNPPPPLCADVICTWSLIKLECIVLLGA